MYVKDEGTDVKDEGTDVKHEGLMTENCVSTDPTGTIITEAIV